MSDIVKLNLLESYVIPIVTCAIDSVDLSQKQIHELVFVIITYSDVSLAYVSGSLLH